MYAISCPYCPKGHMISSEFWDVVEEKLQVCRDKAPLSALGLMEYAVEERTHPEVIAMLDAVTQ